MARLRLAPNETVLFDVSAPHSALILPVLEAVLITGICWMGIGYLDRPGAIPSPDFRNLIVGGWALLLGWRLVVPALRARAQRFIVTNRRIITHARGLGGGFEAIPLAAVRRVNRRGRRTLELVVQGYPGPLWYRDVPKSRKAAESIAGQMPYYG